MIEFKNVTKIYPDGTNSLKNLSLKIEDGEFLFIVGSSGAGKSTLIKILMCEEKLTEGSLIINGVDISKIKYSKIPHLRRQLGVVFQDFRLIPSLNVYDNIAFAMRVLGKSTKEIKERVPAMLDLVELTSKGQNMPHNLSGGEKQRVALARALINSPKIIIADEPTGNIDPEMSMDIMRLLNGISQRGNITVLVVTHEKELVDTFEKRVVTLSDGEIISDKTGGYV
ncbi:MAG: cell division ATP-binding protein FtsE [Clostridia bacterium]